MRTSALAAMILLAMVAGCSRQPSNESGLGRDKDRASAQVAGAAPARPQRDPASSVAAYPDQGRLLVYESSLQARRRGAYTYYPVNLSEEHALHGITSGMIHMPGPDGRSIDLTYERHIEHPDGNWTWIGRDAQGNDAILTFGEKAVFGTIPTSDQGSLRVTIADGRTWLIATDATAIAKLDNALTRPKAPDYLIPPRIGGGPAGSGPRMAATIAQGVDAAADGAPTVDVVLGYTTGFASRLGGQSQAVTRLTYLTDVTNQAYLNSQLSVRVRLVGTVQVNYPDATDNGDALEKLTGYKSGSGGGWTSPDPAFLALRAARDQYGADLVSLVRKFNDPENDGCGIAWLIGGGQSGLASDDEPFGYSVVSDSSGSLYPDGGFVCREESLAHEFGHNMGSQHDRLTAQGDDGVLANSEYGRYPYSFGYKTGLGTGNFYTVMGYGDKGQTKYRLFSNPRITSCGGWACGVVDQADNARSLAQTTPIVATFRASVVVAAPPVVRNDVDGDGKSDLLWYSTSQVFAYWIMNGAARTRYRTQSVAAGYSPVTSGDYNADGRVDVAWRNGAGAMQMWIGDGTSFAIAQTVAYPTGWTPMGSADVDGDGKSDLLWYSSSSQLFAYWIMDGATRVRYRTLSVPAGYAPMSSGDYNGDGRIDLVWRNGANATQMWFGDGFGFSAQPFLGAPAGWQSIGSGDVDADGKSDLLWYQPTQQILSYWIMSGTTRIRYRTQAVLPGYVPLSNGDYSGDGRLDLFWNKPAVPMQFWLGTGVQFTAESSIAAPGGWSAVAGLQ